MGVERRYGTYNSTDDDDTFFPFSPLFIFLFLWCTPVPPKENSTELLYESSHNNILHNCCYKKIYYICIIKCNCKIYTGVEKLPGNKSSNPLFFVLFFFRITKKQITICNFACVYIYVYKVVGYIRAQECRIYELNHSILILYTLYSLIKT